MLTLSSLLTATHSATCDEKMAPWRPVLVNDLQLTIISEVRTYDLGNWTLHNLRNWHTENDIYIYEMYVYIFPWCHMGLFHNELMPDKTLQTENVQEQQHINFDYENSKDIFSFRGLRKYFWLKYHCFMFYTDKHLHAVGFVYIFSYGLIMYLFSYIGKEKLWNWE